MKESDLIATAATSVLPIAIANCSAARPDASPDELHKAAAVVAADAAQALLRELMARGIRFDPDMILRGAKA